MLEISLNVYYTIALAILVLMLGDFIKKHVAVLRKFCIPTPVVGGVLFAILITVLNMSGICQVSLNSSFNEFFIIFIGGIGVTSTALKHQARLQSWAEAIQDCRSSGLSVKQWCRQREITTTTYYRWERELLALANAERSTAEDAAVTFAELPTAQQQRNVSERAATIRLGNISIDIYNEVNPELLKVILATLQSC